MVVVMDAIIDGLNAYIKDFQIKMETHTEENQMARHASALEALKTELKKQEQRKKRLFDSWEADDGMYTKEEFIERKQLYTHTIEELKQKIKEAKANTPKPVNYEEQITTLQAVIESLKSPDISAKEKNIFLKQVIEKITYDAEDYGQNRGGRPILEIFLK